MARGAKYNYRADQFENVATLYQEYAPKIKIIKPDGETKWMDITEGELLKIKAILVDQAGTVG